MQKVFEWVPPHALRDKDWSKPLLWKVKLRSCSPPSPPSPPRGNHAPTNLFDFILFLSQSSSVPHLRPYFTEVVRCNHVKWIRQWYKYDGDTETLLRLLEWHGCGGYQVPLTSIGTTFPFARWPVEHLLAFVDSHRRSWDWGGPRVAWIFAVHYACIMLAKANKPSAFCISRGQE
jgi:hypothetical protein